MSTLHVSEPRQLVELFGGLPDSVCSPGRHLLFQEPIQGGKVKYVEGKPEPVVDKKRPYFIFLLNDAVIVGKAMSGIVSTSYRGHAYPLRKCELWIPADAKALAPSDPHVLRLRCGGTLPFEIDPLAYAVAKAEERRAVHKGTFSLSDAPADTDGEYLLICSSAEQQQRLHNSFIFLKRRVSPQMFAGGGPEMLSRPSIISGSGMAVAAAPLSSLEGEPRIRAHARVPVRSTAHHSPSLPPSSSRASGRVAAIGPEDLDLRAAETARDDPDRVSSRSSLASAGRGFEALKAIETRLRDTGVVSDEPATRTSLASHASGGVSGGGAGGGKEEEDDKRVAFQSTGHGLTLPVDDFPSLPVMSAAIGPIDEASKYRHKVYTELYETEKDYVRSLQVLAKIFIKPLRDEAATATPIVGLSTIATIFSNSESVLDLHAELLTHMRDGLRDDGHSRLSDVFSDSFMRVIPFFRIYATYCKNYWHALEVLRQEEETNEKFQMFLHVCSLKPETQRHDLSSFLIKPVQRICKYPLLFRDLIRHMDAGHPNRAKLEVALAEVERLASEVNDRINAEQRQRRIFDVYTLLEGSVPDLVQPQRKFLLDIPEIMVAFPMGSEATEGAWDRFAWSTAGKPKALRIFVFSDILILAQFTHFGKANAVLDEAMPSTPSPSTPDNGPLQGLAKGARYKVIETIQLKDINVGNLAPSSTPLATPGSVASFSSSTMSVDTAVDRATFSPTESVGPPLTPFSTPSHGAAPMSTMSTTSACAPVDHSVICITFTKQVASKDGSSGTAVGRFIIQCVSEAQWQQIHLVVGDAARTCQKLVRDLQERRLSAAPGRTRNWRRKTNQYGTLGSTRSGTRGSVEGLTFLQGKYASTPSGTEEPGEDGDGGIGSDGGADGTPCSTPQPTATAAATVTTASTTSSSGIRPTLDACVGVAMPKHSADTHVLPARPSVSSAPVALTPNAHVVAMFVSPTGHGHPVRPGFTVPSILASESPSSASGAVSGVTPGSRRPLPALPSSITPKA